MGQQNSILLFTGKLGNLIGYRRNGKYLLRSMPEIVRQSARTRRAAQRFGMASKTGALIRHAFYGELDVCRDKSHINRLTTVLIPSAGDNIKGLTGFRFNEHTGTDKFFILSPQLSADGKLHIPAQTLPVFKGITSLEVKVIATRINFTTHEVVGTDSDVLIVEAGKFFNGAAFPVDVPGNGTLMVTLQVRGLQNNILSHNARYLAADIVAVQTPQTLEVFHKQIYPQPRNIPYTNYIHSQPSVIQRE
ncbi:hypothetical protein [Chitinophaga tropicalis]|uniref:Uncharacterized protein n=1 Tax=Chitinophaga tropicalis TaxID=2683588 RepID=A0A7K1UAJ9_9BACT|nr:hypothetical protein [Chitinophaga tropicalis]MVT11397.1 hypothetical protein [Chitinophaga tropicalis]